MNKPVKPSMPSRKVQQQPVSVFDYQPVKSKPKSKADGELAVASVVSAKECGHRVNVKETVVHKLGSPKTVNVAFNDVGVLISSKLPGCEDEFVLRKSGKNAVIYCRGLVEELIQQFGLDFSSVTSISFQKVTYREIDGVPAAFIPMRRVAEVTSEEN